MLQAVELLLKLTNGSTYTLKPQHLCIMMHRVIVFSLAQLMLVGNVNVVDEHLLWDWKNMLSHHSGAHHSYLFDIFSNIWLRKKNKNSISVTLGRSSLKCVETINSKDQYAFPNPEPKPPTQLPTNLTPIHPHQHAHTFYDGRMFRPEYLMN